VRTDKKIIQENMKRMLLKEYIMENTRRAGFGGVNIQRTVTCTRITLEVERPGLVIGRKGGAIKRMGSVIESKFGQENPVIEVEEVKNPALNPYIMAEKLAQALERGWHFRRAGHATVRSIMAAGARGCQVIIAGKLTGERHRTEKFTKGTIKYCGDTAQRLMRVGYVTAKLKPGIIGVTVKIMPPDAKLPDDISFKEEEVKPEAPPEGVVAPAAPVPAEEEIPAEKEKEILEKAKKVARVKGMEEVLEEEAPEDILKVKISEQEEQEAEKEGDTEHAREGSEGAEATKEASDKKRISEEKK